MDRLGIRIVASFPDVNVAGARTRKDDAVEVGQPSSLGRLVSQAVAFKLLAGLTLVLLAIAAAPVFFGRGSKPAGPPSAWCPTPAASPKSAPTVAASRPATIVPATPRPSQPPATVPPTAETATAQKLVPPLASSRWPDPAHAVASDNRARGEFPKAASNQPMTVRPTEYEADVRSDSSKASAWPRSDKPL